MTDRVRGKVALITGAARGQGRSHAVRLAEEGARIIAVDVCRQLDTVKSYYDMPSPADLEETARLVRDAGGEARTAEADVRDLVAMQQAVDGGLEAFGRLDTVVANAGIFTFNPLPEQEQDAWHELIDVNVTGVWNTVKAAAPGLIRTGPGGSVMIISSLAGSKGFPNLAAYSTSKHAVVGLMKVLALELGPHGIRVNTIHPNAIDTPMVANSDRLFKLFRPDLQDPSPEDVAAVMERMNPMGVGMLDPIHVSNVVLFLASDEAYYVSGAQIPVDAGAGLQ